MGKFKQYKNFNNYLGILKMLINLEIDLDLDNERDKDWLKWYHQTDPDPKETIFLAYSVITSGLSTYYRDYYKNNLDYQIKAEIQSQQDTLKQKYCDDLIGIRSERDDEILKLKRENNLLILDHESKYISMINKKDNDILSLRGSNKSLLKENEEFSDRLALCKANVEKEITFNMEKLNFDKTMSMQKEKIEKESVIDLQKTTISELKQLLSEKSDEISLILNEKNREENQALRHKLEVLQSSNSYKGITGESELINYLQCAFDSLTIINRGKTAHSCDIHMIDKEDNLIVFESKWKQNIEKSDISKFNSDLQNLAESPCKVIGGVFVSFLTSNIPGKGKLLFELGPENVPVCYVGYSSLNDFKMRFCDVAELFRNFCRIYKELDVKSDSNEYVDELNYLFNLLVKNKTRIEDFRLNGLQKINKFVADIENENRGMYNRIEHLLKKNNSLKLKTNLSHCSNCNEHFTSKKMLEKHLKSCGK